LRLAGLQIGEAGLEAGAVIASSGRTTLMQVPLVDPGGQQRIAL
jgi:hypothetical protein